MKTKQLRPRQWCVTAIVLSIAVVLAPDSRAQSSDWNKIVDAAKKEGHIIVYTNAVPAVNERLKADFEKANPGLTVELSRLVAAGELVSRLDQERTSGADGADLTLTTELKWAMDRHAEGASFVKPTGPSSVAWPEKFVTEGLFPTLALEPLVIGYNTTLVKNPITAYQDLLRPEFKDKLAISEPVSSAVVAWYDFLEQTQGADYLQKLAAQHPKMLIGAVPNAQAIASGEVQVTGFTNPTTAKPLIDQGAPIKIVVPNPGFGIGYFGVLVGWSKRPNAAQVFMDYVMSPRGQEVWAGRGEVASPLAVPGSLDAQTIHPFDASKYPSNIMVSYKEKWTGIFRQK